MSMSHDQISRAVQAKADELFDGYVICGIVAGSDEPVIIRKDSNGDLRYSKRTALALNNLLTAALQMCGGPPADGDKPVAG